MNLNQYFVVNNEWRYEICVGQLTSFDVRTGEMMARYFNVYGGGWDPETQFVNIGNSDQIDFYTDKEAWKAAIETHLNTALAKLVTA
jgi:hypothetical protein